MAVHNCLPYLEESVRSILVQTLTDFEFVIGDDGSSDGSSEVLRRLAGEDSRIRLLRRDRPSGLSGSANWVVGETRAPLVAIMHADDRAYPDRLRREAETLDRDTDAQLVGTLYDGIDAEGRRVRSGDYWRLVRRSAFAPFSHSSIMFRRRAFDEVGGYRIEADYWEDLDLYFRISELGRILVVPEVLASVRFTGMSARLTNHAGRVDEALDLMYRSVADYIGGGAYPERFPPRAGRDDKLVPETYIGRGSVQLWSGHSPYLFGRMMRRAAFGFDLNSLQVLVWTIWATLSPKSLRLALRAVSRLRRMRIASQMSAADPVEWNPARARRTVEPANAKARLARDLAA
jgi:glycosyltransferase involved in cell wall biosynthesis